MPGPALFRSIFRPAGRRWKPVASLRDWRGRLWILHPHEGMAARVMAMPREDGVASSAVHIPMRADVLKVDGNRAASHSHPSGRAPHCRVHKHHAGCVKVVDFA